MAGFGTNRPRVIMGPPPPTLQLRHGWEPLVLIYRNAATGALEVALAPDRSFTSASLREVLDEAMARALAAMARREALHLVPPAEG